MFSPSLIFLKIKVLIKVSFKLFYFIQILRYKFLWLDVSNYPLWWLFSYVLILFDCEPLVRGSQFPWDCHVPWAVDTSFLTGHHNNPTGVSFWLVFMLISHLRPLYLVTGNLDPKPVKLFWDANCLRATLCTPIARVDINLSSWVSEVASEVLLILFHG